MAGISEWHERRIAQWCRRAVDDKLRDRVRMEHRRRGKSVTIVAVQLPHPDLACEPWTEFRVAQLRCSEDGRWTLYRPSGNDRWQPYRRLGEEDGPGPLLAAIERDQRVF